MPQFDAVIVGAGPNGLAAGAHLTNAGRRVLIVEQAETIGGGTRTAELTLPGFVHDVCSAIHPLGVGSPFFKRIGKGIEWVQPEIPVSHPLGEGRAAGLMPGLDASAHLMGADFDRYRRMLRPLVDRADDVIDDFLGPLGVVPRHPVSFGRMAALGARPASTIINRFVTEEARAVLSGLASHSIARLSAPFTGGVMLLFAVTAHSYGWPMVRGGSQGIAEALAKVVADGGGSIQTATMVTTLDELPPAKTYLLDVMPEAAIAIGGDRISSRRALRATKHRPGPGVFKIDWALSGPIPWLDDLSPLAGTVHLGGRYEEVAAAEDEVHAGGHAERPFVLLSQQSRFDPTRAPPGHHTAWAYCHVPRGSDRDMTDAIEGQLERYAPGFRDLVVGRHTMKPADLEAYNPNYLGGDIAGGGFGLKKVVQLGSRSPYRLGEGIYLCSSSTPPGAGVHGMCGYHSAQAALGDSR
jgi:phytoene dehydrogenase-like protein